MGMDMVIIMLMNMLMNMLRVTVSMLVGAVMDVLFGHEF
jgi:hypothetical protein